MKTIRFQELLSYPLRSGATVPKDQRGTGVQFVNMGEIFRHPRLGPVEMDRVQINVSDADRWLLRPGDLLFARRSLTLEGAGKCCLVLESSENRTWESSIIRARLDPKLADSRYFFYYFSSRVGRSSIEAIVNQVAAAGIKSSDLASLIVPFPDLDEQKRVAEVLEAFDKKIEACAAATRGAQSLAFGEFKRFLQCPGLVRKKYGDLNVFGGGTPSTKIPEYWGGEVNWATPTDVTGLSAPYLFGTERPITEEGLRACSSNLFSRDSILMTSRATIGAFAVAQVPTAVNQGFIVVVPSSLEEKWWILHHMQKDVDMMKQLANGATFLELSRRTFKEMPYICPDGESLKIFHQRVNPIHEWAISLQSEIHHLTALREALLPKLMDRTLTVRAAEDLVSNAL